MPEQASVLTDVTIEGLRGVGRVELRLDTKGTRYPADSGKPRRGAVYTFFGANGVGKTKCLEALYQFLLASNKDFLNFAEHTHFGGTSWLVMASMMANGDTFDMSRPYDPNYPFKNSYPFGKDAACLHQLPVVFLGAGRRASLENARTGGAIGKFAKRRQRYFEGLVQAIKSENLRSLGMAGDTRGWFVKRAQSVNLYQKAKDSRQAEIDSVLSMLNTIEPGFDPKALQIDDDDNVFLSVGGEHRELGELSSGYVALLKMVQAIMEGYAAFTNEVQLRNVRGIVLIDEIDAHLHVEWQARIIPCLKKLLPNTTFYIATHSPLVLVQLLKGEAYLLKRGDDGVVRSEQINYPNRRLFVDVLDDALGVDLNKLKLALMEDDDQTDAKQGLLSLLDRLEKREKAGA
jgi:hypothetical protein